VSLRNANNRSSSEKGQSGGNRETGNHHESGIKERGIVRTIEAEKGRSAAGRGKEHGVLGKTRTSSIDDLRPLGSGCKEGKRRI